MARSRGPHPHQSGFKAFVREEFGDWSEAFSAYGGGTAERS
jgi:hypothetical protein